VTGSSVIPSGAAEQIVERQLYFFLDNPNDTCSSPIWYRNLLPLNHESYRNILRPMRHQSRDNASLLVERVL
jgi:hypothetical protein